MKEKTEKKVLIVDDEQSMRLILKEQFFDYNQFGDCPYEFSVDTAKSGAECIQKVQTNEYDVIIMDIRMEEEKSGLDTSFAIYEQMGMETPVRIMFTGYPNYRECVEAIRHGAWDYFVKEDTDDKLLTQIVVDSAIERLKQLDLRKEQEKLIASDWLPNNIRELQAEFSGQLIALWHKPKIKVIVSGKDAFELEKKLKSWRKKHKAWEQPMIVFIPNIAPKEVIGGPENE
jgi:CheY-like chemotaxis protein